MAVARAGRTLLPELGALLWCRCDDWYLWLPAMRAGPRPLLTAMLGPASTAACPLALRPPWLPWLLWPWRACSDAHCSAVDAAPSGASSSSSSSSSSGCGSCGWACARQQVTACGQHLVSMQSNARFVSILPHTWKFLPSKWECCATNVAWGIHRPNTAQDKTLTSLPLQLRGPPSRPPSPPPPPSRCR